jgi:glycosyl transferase, family 25
VKQPATEERGPTRLSRPKRSHSSRLIRTKAMSDKKATVVINLKHRTDRLAAIQQQLRSIGWSAELFAAIRPESAADFPSIGARGCFLSHLSVLKNARDAGIQQLIILEDDLNFVPRFVERWATLISLLRAKEWSIFYPGHTLNDLPAGLSRISSHIGIRCTHFMVINGYAIPTLISGLERILSRPAGDPLGGPMHVDGAYSTIRKQDCSLITYACSPVLGYQRPSRTDVGELKWFDRVGIVAPLLSAARKFKTTIRTFISRE